MRVYLDSNVLISLLKSEIGFGFRGLFIEVDAFFEKIRKGNHTMVLSGLFFEEVEKLTYATKNEIISKFGLWNIQIEVIEKGVEMELDAIEEKGTHFPDSLHVALAIEASCDVIVTFNIKDFAPAHEWIRALKPMDFE